MGHDALQPQRRSGNKARHQCTDLIGSNPLAAHAGINFQMQRNRTRSRARRAGSRFQLVQLPWLPDHGCKVVANHSRALTGKRAADNQNPRLRAQRACGHALVHVRDAQPPGAGTHHGRSAKAERVAVGIGLDNGQQLRLRGGQSAKKTVIVFKKTGLNFNPTGAYCSQIVHSSV